MGKWYIMLTAMGIGSVNGFTIPAWAWILVAFLTVLAQLSKIIELTEDK